MINSGREASPPTVSIPFGATWKLVESGLSHKWALSYNGMCLSVPDVEEEKALLSERDQMLVAVWAAFDELNGPK
jgi:hypothetical protein